MKYIKNLYTWCFLLIAGLTGVFVTSCVDSDFDENYYIFKGEMMSQYLQSHEEFSKFAQIVKRSKDSKRNVDIMDLISAYGQFTCFAPTNEAVDKYLNEHGYESIDDIPSDECDTIARTHLINGIVYNTIDFMGLSAVPTVNMNERYLSIEESLIIEDEDTIATTYRLNRGGVVDRYNCNDTVANGIIHAVDQVLVSSTQTIENLLSENPEVKLFSDALQATGIGFTMAKKIKDETWNYYAKEYEGYHGKVIYSGAQNDWSDIPMTRNFKFTIFACPDSILEQKYGITDLKSFYDYAKSIYGGPDFDPDNLDALKEQNSPLRRLIGYNCLPFATTYDKYTVITSQKTNEQNAYINPHEWFSTMDTLTTIKILRLLSAKDIREHGGIKNDLYLNRGDMIRSFQPGVHVDRTIGGDYIQEAINGIYFTTDGLVDYGPVTKEEIFNTRIRFDMVDLFPEFYSNNLRNETPWNTESCESPTAPAKNWILPNGYLDDVKINQDGILLYQGARSWYWSYQGDEFNTVSDHNSYDVEFSLPSVPTGTYQIRLGFCAMPSRGICQFYLDGIPQGLPLDARDDNMQQRTGWIALNDTKMKNDPEYREATKKTMHNNGWYHGPKSVFTTPYGTKDGTAALAAIGEGNLWCNQMTTSRLVIATGTLDENIKHRIRVKSVWAVGSALMMMDYFEIVPKSVYGVEAEGKAEDEY